MGDDLAFNMDPSFLEVMNRAFWTANQLLAEAPDIDDYGYEDQLAKLQDAYDVYWKLYGAFSYLRDDLRDADEGFHKSVNHTADSLENLSLKDIIIWREHYEDYSNGCGREEITLLDYVDTISSPDIMYLNVFQMIMWDTVPDDIEAVTIEEYLLNLEEEASFDMDYYCPEQQGLKDTLDLLGMGIKPMYDAISGYDIITGEQLSSKERRKAGGRAALEIALTLAGPLGVYDAIFSKVGAVSTKIWGKLGPKIAPKVDDIIRTIGESGAGRKISSLADDIARIIEDNLDDFAWMGKEAERYTYNTGEELLEITAGRYGSVAENAGREVQILNDVDAIHVDTIDVDAINVDTIDANAIHVDSIDVDDIVGEQYEEIFEWQREVNEEYESFLEDLITYDEVPDVEPIYDVGEAGQLEQVVGKSGSKSADLGNKLDYIFGKGTGNKHNIQRSQSMQIELEKIGIYDDLSGRDYLTQHLNKVLNDSSNISSVEVRSYVAKEIAGNPTIEYTATTRESLLMGPYGGVKLKTIWDGDRLLTIIIEGGH